MKHREKIRGLHQNPKPQRSKRKQTLLIPIMALSAVLAFLVYDFIKRGQINTTDGEVNYAQAPQLLPETQEENIDSTFKMEQMRFSRYLKAHDQKIDSLKVLLKENGINSPNFELYLRVFKKEQLVELWIRDKNQSPKFTLLKTYDFCETSGNLGPKRKEGDKQIPEGFYHIDRFNPSSKFHLSLGINYPNLVDEVLADSLDPGGEIFIHGGCATVGCIPITDEKIKELYVLAVEAKETGQRKIPVSIFPSRLDDVSFQGLKDEFSEKPLLIAFWKSLKVGYDYFEKCRELPTIRLTETGKYIVSDKCPN